jgi:phospholipase/lecithinase/hemolysin
MNFGESMMSSGFKARAWRAFVAALSLCALAACGGGDTEVPFDPNRVLAFGDELSFIEAPADGGRKYSINAFKITDSTTNPPTESTTELDCTRNALWVQRVASGFGLVFDRCLGSATTASGQILAQPGHKVADLPAQIAAVQGATLNERDLALMLIGMHDILELYGRYPTESKSALLDEARSRATDYGERINALARSGPAVVVLTVPDLGLTPFARAQNTSSGDPSRSRFLSELTTAFNNRMSVTLINDGRLIGLIYADTESQNMHRFPGSFGLSNVNDAACQASSALPDCRTNTLVTGATSSNYMWADDLRPGPAVQSRLGSLAEFRAKNNPF